MCQTRKFALSGRSLWARTNCLIFSSNKCPLVLCYFEWIVDFLPMSLLWWHYFLLLSTLPSTDEMFFSSGCLPDGSQTELQMMATLTTCTHVTPGPKYSWPLPSSNHMTADPNLPKPIRHQLSLHGWHVLPIKKKKKKKIKQTKKSKTNWYIYVYILYFWE